MGIIPSDNLSIYVGPLPVCEGLIRTDTDLLVIYGGLMVINKRQEPGFGGRALIYEPPESSGDSLKDF